MKSYRTISAYIASKPTSSLISELLIIDYYWTKMISSLLSEKQTFLRMETFYHCNSMDVDLELLGLKPWPSQRRDRILAPRCPHLGRSLCEDAPAELRGPGEALAPGLAASVLPTSRGAPGFPQYAARPQGSPFPQPVVTKISTFSSTLSSPLLWAPLPHLRPSCNWSRPAVRTDPCPPCVWPPE